MKALPIEEINRIYQAADSRRQMIAMQYFLDQGGSRSKKSGQELKDGLAGDDADVRRHDLKLLTESLRHAGLLRKVDRG